MVSSLGRLLAQLSSDNLERGKQFERLVKWFLKNSPEHKALIREVWHWKTSPHKWGRETGIDLTAEGHDGQLWAIQAKAYAADYYVTKHDVDKFLSETGRKPLGRKPFTVRVLVATTDNLGPNAKAVLNDTPGVVRILRTDLEKARVEWPRSFAELRPQKPKPAKARPHQGRAVRDVLAGFRSHDRGQLLMACGTGKTLTSLWTAEALRAKRVLVLVPSLTLARQTLSEWYANGKHQPPYIVVCSDHSVSQDEDGDQIVSAKSDLNIPPTTAPAAIANFLKGQSRRYVFSTYQSTPQIRAAFVNNPGLRGFDLVVADEAHRLVGASTSGFATILDAKAIPARRRLFLTATPRIATGRLRKHARVLDVELASMDDSALFGPVFHKLSFAGAIRQKLLADYQLAVVCITDEAVREDVDRAALATLDGVVTDARTLACQLGLATSMRKFDLRRVVTFHSRVSWASRFAVQFGQTVRRMSSRRQVPGDLWCGHVSGRQSAADREIVLRALKHLPPDCRGLVTNARCLTEGIDVPALDGIAFIDPRRSETDVVQAVGRAIRPASNKKIGTVVVPLFLGEGQDPEEALDGSSFKQVWQVVQALRSHDEVLGAELDLLRRELGRRGSVGRLPGKIRLIGLRELGARFYDAFDARLVAESTSAWEFWFGLLLAYFARYKILRVRRTYKTEGGFKLGVWVGAQRDLRSQGKLLPEREARLSRLPGWTWGPLDEVWENQFCELVRFAERHGHTTVPKESFTKHGSDLGSWVVTQRKQFREKKLEADRADRLAALPGWTWSPFEGAWGNAFRRLRAFVKKRGHSKVMKDFVDNDGFGLGGWVDRQRQNYARGVLDEDRALRLSALIGWSWGPSSDAWSKGFESLSGFVREHGHALVPAKYVGQDGFRLGGWVNSQRTKYNRGLLQKDRIAQLSRVDGWSWNARKTVWETGLEKLRGFVAANGHAQVPFTFVAKDGFKLGKWAARLRAQRARGKLAPKRVNQLAGLPGWSWNVVSDSWEEGFVHFRKFVESHGHGRVPQRYRCKEGFGLGTWVNAQRLRKKKGQLNAHLMERLQAAKGWEWDVRQRQWKQGLEQLRRFVAGQGHAFVPASFVAPDGFQLGRWVANQRHRYKRGRLKKSYVKELTSMKGWRW